MRPPTRAGRLLAALVLAWLSAGPAAEAANGHVTIGVRVDGGPFARRDPDTGRFRGYLVDLCREAVTRADYTFTERPVTATQRIGVLKGEIDVADAVTGPWKLDLLCDPTTISLQRLGSLAGLPSEALSFTQVVFVANGSYVELKAKSPRRRAERWSPVECPSVEGDPAGAAVYVAGYVVGTTSRTIIKREARARGEDWCLRSAAGHEEAVTAVCRGEIDYYFGDLDIIDFYRRRVAETDGKCAEIEPPREVTSYEPYALLVSNNTPGFRPRFLAALYELFSDGTAAQRFSSHFGGASQSTALALLFRINSVPGLRDE